MDMSHGMCFAPSSVSGVSEGQRMKFKDVRGGVTVGCLHLLCEGRRTQVDVRMWVFETEVVF